MGTETCDRYCEAEYDIRITKNVKKTILALRKVGHLNIKTKNV